MSQFFELPNEILLEIYKTLSPQELLAIASTGEKSQKLRREALKALFMQRTEEAIKVQQRMLEYWMDHPNPLAPPRDILLSALKHMDVFHQIMGLGIVNHTENTTNQELQHYLNHLIEQTQPEIVTIHDLLHLLQVVPVLNENNIETVLPFLQENLSSEDIPIRQSTLELITALAPRLTPEQISPFFPELLENLKNPVLVRKQCIESFRALANRLNAEQLNPLIPELQECLEYADERVNEMALEVISVLADKFNQEQLSLFIDKAQSTLEAILNILDAPPGNLDDDQENLDENKDTPEVDEVSQDEAMELLQLCKVALYTIKPLASKLSAEQLERFFLVLINYLPHQEYWIRSTHLLSILMALAKNSAHPALLFERIQSADPKFIAHPNTRIVLNILATKLQISLPGSKASDAFRLAALEKDMARSDNTLTQEEINSRISTWLEHLNSDDEKETLRVLGTLEANVHLLSTNQLELLLPGLQKNLKHSNFSIRVAVLVNLGLLGDKLAPELLIPLIPEVLKNLHDESDDISDAASPTLQAWAHQSQNLAKAVLNNLVNALRKSKEAPQTEKLWETLFALEQYQNNFRTSNILNHIGSVESLTYLFTQITMLIEDNGLLMQDELSIQYFLVHLLERLNKSAQIEAANKLLSISCNSDIEPELRDVALQALGCWTMELVRTQQQELINTLNSSIDETALKTNDKYSILLLAIKSQIAQAAPTSTLTFK